MAEAVPSPSSSPPPPGADKLAALSGRAWRHGPALLAARDVLTCLRMFPWYFLTIFLPFLTDDPTDEFYFRGANAVGLVILVVVSVAEFLFLVLAVPAFVILPGIGIVVAIFIVFGGVALAFDPVQGPGVVLSAPPIDDAKALERYTSFPHERWVFVNGCCVTGWALQQNVNRLSRLFGRPVLGVHNRTHGLVGDLLECIVQRSFNFYFQDTRIAFEYVQGYLARHDITKVVLIGHSQGGIIVSQILDDLFMALPHNAVAKLEVYTFASAASHCNNPLKRVEQLAATNRPIKLNVPQVGTLGATAGLENPLQFTDSPTHEAPPITSLSAPTHMEPSKGSDRFRGSPLGPVDTNLTRPSYIPPPSRAFTTSPLLPERVIPHIEHYCNSKDMVTRWGALYSAEEVLRNRFCGHVFVIENGSGHMLNQHYLSTIFPIGRTPSGEHPFLDRIIDVESVSLRAVGPPNGNAAAGKPDGKLSSPVAVTKLHTDAGGATVAVGAAAKKDVDGGVVLETDLLGSGEVLSLKDIAGAEGTRLSIVLPSGELGGNPAQPTRVRDVSRLWRYLGGESPPD